MLTTSYHKQIFWSDPFHERNRCRDRKFTPSESIVTPNRHFQIGNLTNSESWKSSGKEEHAEGEAEYKAAQAKGYAEGTMDRVAGYKDSVVGAVTGDNSQQVEGKRYVFCRSSIST